MNKPPTKRTRPLPSLTLGREIGKTLYIVQGEFSATATENTTQKARRLILRELEEKSLKSG